MNSKIFLINVQCINKKTPLPEFRKRGFGLRLSHAVALYKIPLLGILSEQGQYLLRCHVCLGEHGGTGLHQDLVLCE